MRINRIRWMVLLAVPAFLCVQGQGTAQTPAELNPLGLSLVRQHAETYVPGQPFEVAVTISAAAAGQITAMGLRETLPPDWRLEAVAGASGPPPDLSPAPGATNLLEFAWITVPAFPYTFTYVVTPPGGDGGNKVLHGALEYRQMTGAHYAAPVLTEVTGPNPEPPTITLKGANPVTLDVGEAWQEPGYTALDSENRDITGKVVVSGTVDTSRPGEYQLEYAVATDDGQRASAARTVVVREAETAPVTPSTGGGGGAPPREPGPSGRELSNPIAASVDKNASGNTAAQTPATTGSETGAALQKPELPDLSAFRPPATPEPGTKAPPAAPSATASAPPTASTLPVQHRAPVPPEMLKAAALRETAQKNDGAASLTTPTVTPKPPASGNTATGSFLPAVLGAAAALALLAVLGVVGWRLVYNRPVRRRRPPVPPAR